MLEGRAAYMVTFADKHIPKEFGAQWCKEERVWVAPDDAVMELMDAHGFGRVVEPIPFCIPFKDKDDAKRAGAIWHEKHWCARTNEQAAQFEKRWKRA